MKKFDTVVATFIELLKAHTGAKPLFSIDFVKEHIIISEAPSGFVKVLSNVEGAVVHLTKEGLTFSLFA